MISVFGLLVAGGKAGRGLDVVEMINPETFRSCVLDLKLDHPRGNHTGNGDLGAVHKLRHFKIDLCGSSNNDSNMMLYT